MLAMQVNYSILHGVTMGKFIPTNIVLMQFNSPHKPINEVVHTT